MADQADPEHEIEALIHPGDDGKFWAEVVGLAGCYTQGDNYSKVLARLRDAHQLCSTTTTSPSAPPDPDGLSLEDASSMGDLMAVLTANGWSAQPGASEIHSLFEQAGTGALLCVPNESGELLNSGFRLAINAYLGVRE